jgi:thiol:disulfide interchange protein DsbD
VSCKVNERLVLRTPEIRARIEQLGVVPMKADWTNEDEVITRALQEFGRSGVPLYVLYGRDAKAPAVVLPAVLSTSIVLGALDALK